jgi:DNA invertase Pin-like site-specific DNA recombinase
MNSMDPKKTTPDSTTDAAEGADFDAEALGRFDLSTLWSQTSPPTAEAAYTRPLGMAVNRESDEDDRVRFENLCEMTYQNLRDIPAMEAIRKVGMAPMQGRSFEVEWEVEGKQVTREVTVHIIREGRTKVRVFYFEGYWHVWSQASASLPAQDGNNEFTTILADLLRTHRPQVLYAAYLSRIVRSTVEEKRLTMALSGNVDRLEVKDMSFQLTGPDAAIGFMSLTMMAWCAAMERTAIVQRLLAGRIATWRRQEWPFGSTMVPFGYDYDEDTRTIRPDPTKREAVQAMMTILASNLPAGQMALELDRAGVTPMRRYKKSGRRALFSSQAHPDKVIRSMYAWAPLWVCGEYLMRFSNPMPDIDELSGLAVVRYEHLDDDPGEFQMLFQFDLPDGGWASPELLTAFMNAAGDVQYEAVTSGGVRAPRAFGDHAAAMSRNAGLHRRQLAGSHLRKSDRDSLVRRSAGRARRIVSALSGRAWTDGIWSYELLSQSSDLYKVVRWPAPTNPATTNTGDDTQDRA